MAWWPRLPMPDDRTPPCAAGGRTAAPARGSRRSRGGEHRDRRALDRARPGLVGPGHAEGRRGRRRRPGVAAAAHDTGHRRRSGPRGGRRAHPGTHPESPGRPRPARRQCRGGVRRLRGRLRLRRDVGGGLGVVGPRRCAGRGPRRVRHGHAGRRRRPGHPRAGRRGRHRAARIAHQRAGADGLRDAGHLPVLGGRFPRRPRRGRARAGTSLPRRRPAARRGQRTGAEHPADGGGRRPRPRSTDRPGTGLRTGRGHPAHRYRGGRERADRLHRPRRPACRACHHRPGPPVAAAVLRPARRGVAGRGGRPGPRRGPPGRAAGRSGPGLRRGAVLHRPGAPPPAGDAVSGQPQLLDRRAFRVGPVSAVWRPRAGLVPLLLAAAALLLAAVDVGRGDYPIGVLDVLRILTGGGEPADRFVVVELRLPKVVTALVVGLAFGMSGAILQSIARNPVAGPDILGITQGAGAGAVALIVLGGGALSGAAAFIGPPVAALVGGTLAATVIYLLAWRRGVSGFRLVLVGIAVAAMLTSLISWLLIVADITEASQATVWLTGSLNGRGWEHVVPVVLVMATVGTLALLGSSNLAALRLGDDTARALGVRLQTGQTALLAVAVVLASVAVAAAGPIPFVALLAPQVALRLLRSAGPRVLAGGLTGAVLVVVSDLVSRTVLPVE